MCFSNSQIDRLGKKLRDGSKEEEDIKMLETFRKSFEDMGQMLYKEIKKIVANENIEITARNTKTHMSILDKLRRQKTLRLSKIQDIEGCRIVIKDNLLEQQKIKDILINQFEPKYKIIVKERNNKEGYRAIHIIVKQNKKHYEIQLRTLVQDVWANMIESLAKSDNELKYGKGDEMIQNQMKNLSERFYEEIDCNEKLNKSSLKDAIEITIKNVFLIEHNRDNKKTNVKEFYSLSEAKNERFKKEWQYIQQGRNEMEVVVFESDSIDTLQATHSRYFYGKSNANNTGKTIVALGLVTLGILAIQKLLKD